MESIIKVKTNYGFLNGIDDGNIQLFRGIPYAKAPIGKYRFKRSVECEPWFGELDCTSFSKKAFQKNRKDDYSDMSEDCLYLNIWTPKADCNKRPVVVYIHGGSFCSGTGSNEDCRGNILSEKGDIVFVTINYRLGVLGFLDFEKYGDFDSNCGYSDIINALKWTYENIDCFGGDPDRITVMGQSAGAITISALITGVESRKYISKAFMLSSGPTLFQTHEEAMNLADKFLDYSCINPDDLRNISPETIIGFQKGFSSYCGLGAGTYTITVDNDLVKRWPIPSAVNGFDKHIPVVMGNTKEEMAFLFVKPVAKALEVDGIMNEGVAKEPEDVRKKIPLLYEKLYDKRAKSIMMADLVFRLPSTWFAEVYSCHSDIWMYSFEYETIAAKISGLRAFHSSDMPFFFGDFKAGLAKLTFSLTFDKTKARNLSDIMQDDFIKFVRTGKCDWQKCNGADTPVKAYNTDITYHPAIEPEIKRAFLASEFRKRSFEEYYKKFCDMQN